MGGQAREVLSARDAATMAGAAGAALLGVAATPYKGKTRGEVLGETLSGRKVEAPKEQGAMDRWGLRNPPQGR